MTQPLAVSVVMSTYNRDGLLTEAIESVLAQRTPAPPFELVVVDNNSTDGTRAVIEGFVARYPGRLRYVFEERQGVSHGRNAGIAHATAPIIAFTDDDVRVAPDWVASIVCALAAHPEIDYVGGKVLPRWPAPPPRWLDQSHWAPLALTDYGDSAFAVGRADPRCLVSANLAMRRTALDLVGNFNPAFDSRPGRTLSSVEDHEIQLRLWRLGRQGMYAPSVVVEAEVQPNRLTKAYHRRWYRDHSRLAPLIYQRGELIDVTGALVTRTGGRSIFGIPAWAYREAMMLTGKLAVATVRRRTGEVLRLDGALRGHLEWSKAQWRHRSAVLP
jgi:glycosyltransferase involved in cell wall biosynthesis